jgi:hypothetical protein
VPRENWLRYDGLASGQTIYAYVGGDPISYIDPQGLCKCSDIASTALKYNGATKWSRDDLKDTCHEAVYDILKEAGAPAPERWPSWFPGEYPLGAGTQNGGWGDPKMKIDGWTPVKSPQVGDVVSADGGSGFHHLGIVVELPNGSLGTMNQSSMTGVFNKNDWPFNPKKKIQPGDASPIPVRYWSCSCGK